MSKEEAAHLHGMGTMGDAAGKVNRSGAMDCQAETVWT